MTMDLYAGVVRCSPINANCILDWEAWAAVATAAGVLLALFGPWVAKLRTRNRANALFAIHYMSDLGLIGAELKTLRERFPMGMGTPESWAAEGMMMAEEQYRASLRAAVAVLAERSTIDVDVSRWPAAVDLKLMAHVSLAFKAAKDVAITCEMGGGNIESMDLWPVYFETYSGLLDAAIVACDSALDEVEAAGLKVGLH